MLGDIIENNGDSLDDSHMPRVAVTHRWSSKTVLRVQKCKGRRLSTDYHGKNSPQFDDHPNYGADLEVAYLTQHKSKMLHNSFNWHKHCVTTWREPRRRRTEKKKTLPNIRDRYTP